MNVNFHAFSRQERRQCLNLKSDCVGGGGKQFRGRDQDGRRPFGLTVGVHGSGPDFVPQPAHRRPVVRDDVGRGRRLVCCPLERRGGVLEPGRDFVSGRAGDRAPRDGETSVGGVDRNAGGRGERRDDLRRRRRTGRPGFGAGGRRGGRRRGGRRGGRRGRHRGGSWRRGRGGRGGARCGGNGGQGERDGKSQERKRASDVWTRRRGFNTPPPPPPPPPPSHNL